MKFSEIILFFLHRICHFARISDFQTAAMLTVAFGRYCPETTSRHSSFSKSNTSVSTHFKVSRNGTKSLHEINQHRNLGGFDFLLTQNFNECVGALYFVRINLLNCCAKTILSGKICCSSIFDQTSCSLAQSALRK